MTPDPTPSPTPKETHTHEGDPPYEHSHVDPDCTHRWESCPVHGVPEPDMPTFRVVMTCIYGGSELKDGGTWDQDTSDDVTERIANRLEDSL